MSTDSFANLSDLFARGDHRAEELVYARFAHRLVALARGRLHTQVQGRIDADDVTQSAFRSFFRRHNEQEFHFDDWDGLWALLARITARKCNRANEFHQAQRRDVRRETVASPDQEDCPYARLADREPDPCEVAVFQELLLQLLGRVPEEKRDWIVMRLQGYSVAEISAEVGRTERAVYRLLDRSRQLATEMELDHFG